MVGDVLSVLHLGRLGAAAVWLPWPSGAKFFEHTANADSDLISSLSTVLGILWKPVRRPKIRWREVFSRQSFLEWLGDGGFVFFDKLYRVLVLHVGSRPAVCSHTFCRQLRAVCGDGESPSRIRTRPVGWNVWMDVCQLARVLFVVQRTDGRTKHVLGCGNCIGHLCIVQPHTAAHARQPIGQRTGLVASH